MAARAAAEGGSPFRLFGEVDFCRGWTFAGGAQPYLGGLAVQHRRDRAAGLLDRRATVRAKAAVRRRVPKVLAATTMAPQPKYGMDGA